MAGWLAGDERRRALETLSHSSEIQLPPPPLNVGRAALESSMQSAPDQLAGLRAASSGKLFNLVFQENPMTHLKFFTSMFHALERIRDSRKEEGIKRNLFLPSCELRPARLGFPRPAARLLLLVRKWQRPAMMMLLLLPRRLRVCLVASTAAESEFPGVQSASEAN